MELYALRNISNNDSDLHEADTYFLEKAIHSGKSNIRILKALITESKATVAIKLFPNKRMVNAFQITSMKRDQLRNCVIPIF